MKVGLMPCRRAAAIQDSESLDSVVFPLERCNWDQNGFYRNKEGFKRVYVSQPPVLLIPKFPSSCGYRRGTIDKTLFIKKDKNDIMLVQDKYVAEILKKFDFASVKTASTLIETQKPLTKDEEDADVDVLGNSKNLPSSCLKRILRAPQRKITTGGCPISGGDLFLWHSARMQDNCGLYFYSEAEYVVAANCCEQNPVFHSKTKHIEIRYYFIRYAYEKKLIQVLKITDENVADLLTKAFDVSKFNFLIVNIGMLNL
ncbi:hypothetical protein Tco_1503497 [Tanacetum coccineum]